MLMAYVVAGAVRTPHSETVLYADLVRTGLAPYDKVLGLEYRQALKIMHSVVRRMGATCMPEGDRVSWKDLRSGMACHLLKNGWT